MTLIDDILNQQSSDKSQHFLDTYCATVFERDLKRKNKYVFQDRVKLILDHIGDGVYPNGEIHLSKIEVVKQCRGWGLASIVMEALVTGADYYGVTLTLSPQSYGRDGECLAQRNLAAFYRRYGFRAVRGRVETTENYYRKIWEMERLPR